MARFDRKRWWEQKPTPPKPRYYGITVEAYAVEPFFDKAVGRYSIIWMNVYKPAIYVPGREFYIDQRLTLKEAEALCAVMNAAEEANVHGRPRQHF